MYCKTREEELKFMKQLWKGQSVLCPKCQRGNLELLHKKAKKSNNDWKCPYCNEIFRTIKLLMKLPNE